MSGADGGRAAARAPDSSHASTLMPTETLLGPEATVHGYAVAGLWAAGITGVAALLAGLPNTIDPRKPAQAPAEQDRVAEDDLAPSR